ncbi:putative Cytochrome P450 [Seiridium unicorne]|uniref:Cytochrome P450 n=1 Tax=Seiridium unicorne TaxID=138068 RepID=A0ABR2UMW9_9PEZI
MALSFSLVVGAGAAIYAFLFALLRLTQDAKEPVSIGEGIPFVSPLLNMATKGVGFHRFMRDKYNLPIYTLRMPGSRIYVINAPQLLTSVQNQVRKLSFTAIEASIAANVIGVSKTTNDIIGYDVTADGSYLTSFPKYVHSALSAGPGLDAMNRRSIQYITQSLDTWQKKGDTTVQLFEWVRHELLMASTEGVYGPKNPFRDPAMEKAWYIFEPGMMMFVLNLFPRITAKKSFQAREYMAKVWERYFEAHAYKQGSELIQARVKINDHFGIPLKETARIEIGGSQAILSNTLPATFWVLYHIFSDPKVLEDIRLELSVGVIEDQSGSFIIDLSHVKSSCPIFLSTLKETMRIHSTSSATRIAMEDHLLDNKYLLKKGSTIMMPSHVQHTNPSVWGETVDVFNHKRFLREPGIKRINPVAFRGFGGGTTLCPGRHFASTEILMFTALLVLRFDLRPLSGQWIAPSTANSPMVNAMPVPDSDIDVKLHPINDKAWDVSFSGYDKGMEISAEDIEGNDLGPTHRERSL